MRNERNFTHEEGEFLVNLEVIDQPTEADLAVLLVGNNAISIARITVNQVAIGAVLITSNNRSDVERVLDLLGMIPEAIEQERWGLLSE